MSAPSAPVTPAARRSVPQGPARFVLCSPGRRRRGKARARSPRSRKTPIKSMGRNFARRSGTFPDGPQASRAHFEGFRRGSWSLAAGAGNVLGREGKGSQALASRGVSSGKFRERVSKFRERVSKVRGRVSKVHERRSKLRERRPKLHERRSKLRERVRPRARRSSGVASFLQGHPLPSRTGRPQALQSPPLTPAPGRA